MLHGRYHTCRSARWGQSFVNPRGDMKVGWFPGFPHFIGGLCAPAIPDVKEYSSPAIPHK